MRRALAATEVDDRVDVDLPALRVAAEHDGREDPVGARDVVALGARVERRREGAPRRAARAVVEREDPDRAVADVDVRRAVVERDDRSDHRERGRLVARRRVREERRDEGVARARHAAEVARQNEERFLRIASVVEEREERVVELLHASGLGPPVDREEERRDVEDRALRVRLRDDGPDDRELALLDLALAMEVEERGMTV